MQKQVTSWRGSFVAIITPMSENGDVDYVAFEQLLNWHIAEGTQGIVVTGTTGESPTLTTDECVGLWQYAVKTVGGRIPVIANTGGYSTQKAVELSQLAEQVEVDGLLSVVPYYNKPTQVGLIRHFSKIAEQTSLPILLYNVPGRTITDLSIPSIQELLHIPNIAGIKDATADLTRLSVMVRDFPKEFRLFSGDDPTAAAFMLMGGHGVISVTANVAPAAMRTLCDAAGSSVSVETTISVQSRLLALHTDLFVEPNPIPVKWLLHHMEKIDRGIRLPLAWLEHDAFQKRLLKAVEGF